MPCRAALFVAVRNEQPCNNSKTSYKKGDRANGLQPVFRLLCVECVFFAVSSAFLATAHNGCISIFNRMLASLLASLFSCNWMRMRNFLTWTNGNTVTMIHMHTLTHSLIHSHRRRKRNVFHYRFYLHFNLIGIQHSGLRLFTVCRDTLTWKNWSPNRRIKFVHGAK